MELLHSSAIGDMERWDGTNPEQLHEIIADAAVWSRLIASPVEGWHPQDRLPLVSGLARQVRKNTALACVCKHPGRDVPFALVGLQGISPWHGRAELFWWTAAEHEHKKDIAPFLKILVQIAFRELHLRRVQAVAQVEPTMVTLKSFGFRQEGVCSEWTAVYGSDPEDASLLGCVRKECLVLNDI